VFHSKAFLPVLRALTGVDEIAGKNRTLNSSLENLCEILCQRIAAIHPFESMACNHSSGVGLTSGIPESTAGSVIIYLTQVADE
jgi:hypothetical protein